MMDDVIRYAVNLFLISLTLVTHLATGCSDFTDIGVGLVAQDFGDVISSGVFPRTMDCAKQCDINSLCWGFEWDPGTNTCIQRQYSIYHQTFYTSKPGFRYYRKGTPELKHIGCYTKDSRTNNLIELLDLSGFLPAAAVSSDSHALYHHAVVQCATKAKSSGYDIFGITEYNRCMVWTDSPNTDVAFGGFPKFYKAGCHQVNFVATVGDSDHISVFTFQ